MHNPLGHRWERGNLRSRPHTRFDDAFRNLSTHEAREWVLRRDAQRHVLPIVGLHRGSANLAHETSSLASRAVPPHAGPRRSQTIGGRRRGSTHGPGLGTGCFDMGHTNVCSPGNRIVRPTLDWGTMCLGRAGDAFEP